jgi:hypothetical protein
MDSVKKLFNTTLTKIIDKCLPEICEYYRYKYDIVADKKFDTFIRKCFYYRFGLIETLQKTENISLDKILEEIAFNGHLELDYEIKNKFYVLVEHYKLNVNGRMDDLFMKYF